MVISNKIKASLMMTLLVIVVLVFRFYVLAPKAVPATVAPKAPESAVKVEMAAITTTTTTTTTTANSASSTPAIVTATFNCAKGLSVVAKFDNANNAVDLAWSDGRNFTLPRTKAASGARYANAAETTVFWNKGNVAFLEEDGQITVADCVELAPAAAVGLANPASGNCQKVGGLLKMQKRPDGGEYGLCFFEDNRACEEWALFRSECPVGGVKTTGYDTEAQKFCAWSGGQTTAVANAICTFANGSNCPVDAYYSGSCQPTAK
jgi:putative hemolysin